MRSLAAWSIALRARYSPEKVEEGDGHEGWGLLKVLFNISPAVGRRRGRVSAERPLSRSILQERAPSECCPGSQHQSPPHMCQ